MLPKKERKERNMKKSMTKGTEMGRRMVQEMKQFWKDEQGMGTVEIVLIVVILIGLVLLFKNAIQPVVNDALKSISTNAGKVIK